MLRVWGEGGGGARRAGRFRISARARGGKVSGGGGRREGRLTPAERHADGCRRGCVRVSRGGGYPGVVKCFRLATGGLSPRAGVCVLLYQYLSGCFIKCGEHDRSCSNPARGRAVGKQHQPLSCGLLGSRAVNRSEMETFTRRALASRTRPGQSLRTTRR